MRPRRLRGISRGFPRLSPCGGQVPYVLLTRAPVAGGRVAAPPLPLDLHVLGLSLAFILSQDQTLRCCYIVLSSFLCPPPRALAPRAAGHNGADPGPFIRLRFYLSPFQVSTRTPARRTNPPCAAANRRRPPFVFVISSVASFQCPLPTKGVGSAKVATFSRSAKSPWGFFRGGNRRSPFAVAKVLPFFPTNQIFSQLFSKKICTK